jgi:DNA-binding MarR family transcriptional regulator
VDNLIREFARIFGLIERVMQPYFARFGISGSQWGVLRNLHRAELEGYAGLPLSELSDRLLIRPPSVTGLIDRLQRSGLVRRVPSAADLRVRQIQLTPAGRKLLAQVLTVHDSQVNLVLGGFSPQDQAELRRLLALWGRHLQGLLYSGATVAPGPGLVGDSNGCRQPDPLCAGGDAGAAGSSNGEQRTATGP